MQNDKVIAYESRKLNEHEVRYTTTDLELLAVIHCLRVWECYCRDATLVHVHTDHKPNTTFATKNTLSGRQVRWSEFLSRFNIEWHYKRGVDNPADPLSRDPKFYLSSMQTRLATTPYPFTLSATRVKAL